MTRRNFRRLIILKWLLGFSAVVVSLATTNYLPSELSSYVESQKNVELTVRHWIEFAVGMAGLIFSLIISIGLFLFRGWAKKLLLLSYVIALLMLLPYGPYILTAWVSILTYLTWLIDGGILFLVYQSPFGRTFEAEDAV